MNSTVIAERLKGLRGDRTQQAMADILGISQSTYAMYESGMRIPSDEKKLQIAEVHHKTVQEIFFD